MPNATSPQGATGAGRSVGGGSSGPSGAARAGRRDRPRPNQKPRPFYERYRSQLIGGGATVVVAAAVVFLFLGATAKAYSCSTIMTPAPAASAVPGASPLLGQTQPDMGRTHIALGATQTYLSCPPASGDHVNQPPSGPIPARYYGPDESTIPQGWLHNLEHGGLVVLYSCKDGCPDDATLAKLKAFVTTGFPDSPVCHLPAGNVAPVVTRFDDMSTKFAGLVWDRVLLQDTLDTAQLLKFYATEGEQFNPELLCGASPSPS